ncbi:MAG: GIY-YIG nuclease family protein [Brevundimonas sp.]
MFYVYQLIDPRDRQPFYVGKGKGRRIHRHEAEARRGVHSAKCDRIRAIWADGLAVERHVVAEYGDENEALAAEFDLIAAIGLDSLTNVLPGGVLGREAYMRRLREAETRNEQAMRAAMAKSMAEMAPKLADFLRHRDAGREYGFYVGRRWTDATEALMSVFNMMIRCVGFDRAKSIMEPYGVHLVRGGA